MILLYIYYKSEKAVLILFYSISKHLKLYDLTLYQIGYTGEKVLKKFYIQFMLLNLN